MGNNRPGVSQHWIDQSVLMGTGLSFCGEKKDNCPASAIANGDSQEFIAPLVQPMRRRESSFGQTGAADAPLETPLSIIARTGDPLSAG